MEMVLTSVEMRESKQLRILHHKLLNCKNKQIFALNVNLSENNHFLLDVPAIESA